MSLISKDQNLLNPNLGSSFVGLLVCLESLLVWPHYISVSAGHVGRNR